jgi:hypothetical protein
VKRIGDRLQVGQRRLGRLLLRARAGHGRPHAKHAPARRPAQREEEQHPRRADESMRGIAFEVAVHLEVAECERLRVRAALKRNSGEATHVLRPPSPPAR